MSVQNLGRHRPLSVGSPILDQLELVETHVVAEIDREDLADPWAPSLLLTGRLARNTPVKVNPANM